MMKHKRIERLIQKFMDRAISPAEEKSLKAHIALCAECRRFYEELIQVKERIQELPEYFPDRGFNRRLLARLGYAKTFVWNRLAVALVGLWALLLVFLSSFSRTNELLNRLFTSIPGMVRLINRIGFIVSVLEKTFTPFVRGVLDPVYPITGLLSSVILLYLLSKLITLSSVPTKGRI